MQTISEANERLAVQDAAEAQAEIFWLAFQSLPSAVQQAVRRRLDAPPAMPLELAVELESWQAAAAEALADFEATLHDRNDLVTVELPPPLGGAGREQSGRRPALVLQDERPDLPTIVVAPLTSQLAALRFPYTLRIEPSSENGLSLPSMILLFQIQVVDRLGQFDEQLRNMLKL
jgi:mRNA-degrading endonuclease toxin of MazEF toxin-antitoxin module